ncbi:dihydrolipoyl dehydrogenase [Bacillus cereus]|uniref:dihydrolipoyl dehydrogenase n=1 Tax=Bacillus cereus TaxID=1396 RepID=UPI00359F16CA
MYLYQNHKEFHVELRTSRGETESILNHMKNHEVYDRKKYKGYFSLSQVLEEDLYGEEEDILNWEILMDCYDVVLTRKGIAFREKEEEE